MRVSLFIFLFTSSVSFVSLGQNIDFRFREHLIKAGERKSFTISVKSNDGDSTYIPITILNGQQKDPVLGLIAGIHGYEYTPIMAMQKMPHQLDLNLINGTNIIIQVASVNAFFKRSVFYNPTDGKNLNRVFTGRKDGTITECIAYVISNEIISRCNYLVDIHAGDASVDLHPYVGYYNYGSQTAKAKQMAEALGFSWVTLSENNPRPGQ